MRSDADPYTLGNMLLAVIMLPLTVPLALALWVAETWHRRQERAKREQRAKFVAAWTAAPSPEVDFGGIDVALALKGSNGTVPPSAAPAPAPVARAKGTKRGSNSRAYILDRLDREGKHRLARAVRAGDMSASMAAVKAGFRKQKLSVVGGASYAATA
jgi:4-amino-4-deoxy-L-arabinose transferase-like glycosyltransferase